MKRKMEFGIPKPQAGADRQELFVAGAAGKSTLPWHEPHVREDVEVQINVRQPEHIAMKIKFLADAFGLTKKEVIEQALIEFTNAELKKIGLTP